MTPPGKVYEVVPSGSAKWRFDLVSNIWLPAWSRILTRKLATPATLEEAQRFLSAVLVPLWHVMPSQRIYQRGLELQARYRYHFYDALIIAAALDAGCTRLYSEDLQHDQKTEGLRIENPFIG